MARDFDSMPWVLRNEYVRGPLPQSQFVIVPGTNIYVEIRQERTQNGFVWDVEHGTIQKWGRNHSGSWGRKNAISAARTFANVIQWAVDRIDDKNARMA